MTVLLECRNDNEPIKTVDLLSDAENVIIDYLKDKFDMTESDIDTAYMYGYPKYYVDQLDIVLDWGIDNFHFRIESAFDDVF